MTLHYDLLTISALSETLCDEQCVIQWTWGFPVYYLAFDDDSPSRYWWVYWEDKYAAPGTAFLEEQRTHNENEKKVFSSVESAQTWLDNYAPAWSKCPQCKIVLLKDLGKGVQSMAEVVNKTNPGKVLGSMKDNLFKKTDKVVWDILAGNVGVKTDDGIVTLKLSAANAPDAAAAAAAQTDANNVVETGQIDDFKYELTINPMEGLSVPVPAYAFRTPVGQLKPGDIILLDKGGVAFFMGIGEKKGSTNQSIRVLRPNGVSSNVTIATNALLSTGVMAVKNLFNPGGGTGDTFQQMLPFLLMFNDEGGDLGKILALMTMSGGTQGLANFPMWLLLTGKVGNDKLLPLIMAQQNGGEASNNLLPMLMLMEGGGTGDMMLPLMLLQGKDGKTADIGSLLPLLLMSDKNGAGKDLLPLLLMGGGLGGNGKTDLNSMLPFLLMGGAGKGGADMLPLLMAMGGLKV